MKRDRVHMAQELGLLCNGASGDLALEIEKAQMLVAAFNHWKERRRLCGDTIAVWVLPGQSRMDFVDGVARWSPTNSPS